MILCQATCPYCRTHLFFPAEWRHLLLRCKTCGQVFREAVSTPPAIPAPASLVQVPGTAMATSDGSALPLPNVLPSERNVRAFDAEASVEAGAERATTVPVAEMRVLPGSGEARSTPVADGIAGGSHSPAATPRPTSVPLSPYEQILARRRRVRWIKLSLAAMILMTFGLVLALCWPLLEPTWSSWWARVAQVWERTRGTESAEASVTDDTERPRDVGRPGGTHNNDTSGGDEGSEPVQPLPTRPAPRKPGADKPPRGTKRDFDGRALLIGIQNYFYLNPVNSGALNQPVQGDGRAQHDPLGLRTFRQRLVQMGFREECIGELSDVAENNPHPPLKASLEETIRLFCQESRPQDSLLLVYVGHILVREGKVYLAPIDAKFDSPADKLVALDWLYQQLGQCKARHKAVILDVAHLDPQEGVLRGKEMPLDEEAEKAIAQVPEGVLVWLSCSANQFSYSFGGYGLVGSVFFHMLNESTYTGPDIQGKRNRAALAKAAPFPEWDLPLFRLHHRINGDVKAYLKSLGNMEQEPKMFGKLAAGPAPAANDPFPTPISLKFAPLPEKPIDPAFVDLILEEIRARVSKDRPMRAAALPPFWAKDLDKYKPDYANLTALRGMLEDKPLRKAAFDALDLLDKHERQLRMSFLADPNPDNFRKQIFREQESLATADRELFEFKETLDKIRAAHRDQETPRWQANFDLVYARFIGRMALYREYNFVIGNRLRRDPTLQNPEKNNGWKIVPTDRLQQKETRELARERDKILELILKEHPNTPWEFLAERERATSLGLKVEEARVSP
ncbi:MAG: hypothetical protein NZM42_10855 [Gemmatales bacterium]|nr:hypothetical protein [Gemmatales bacterium]